jgi:hypothetical protein
MFICFFEFPKCPFNRKVKLCTRIHWCWLTACNLRWNTAMDSLGLQATKAKRFSTKIRTLGDFELYSENLKFGDRGPHIIFQHVSLQKWTWNCGVTKVSVGWSLHWDRGDPRSRRSPNSSKGCSRVAGEMSSLEGFFIFLDDVYDVSIYLLTILNQTLGDWNSKSVIR